MPTTIFSDQVYHRRETLEYVLNELIERFSSINEEQYISEGNLNVDFKGQVTVKGIPVLTNDILNDNKITKYDHMLPTFSDTSALGIPAGSSNQQPGCGSPGFLRFNTDTKSFEGFDGKEWARFRTTTRVENPEYSEEFVVNPDSYWEYDSWCLFGNNTDARKRVIQYYMLDVMPGSLSQGQWINPGNYATLAVKDKRFIRVYNKHVNSLQFFIKVG